jgi:hypothetical protein
MSVAENIMINFPKLVRWEEFEVKMNDIIEQLKPFEDMVVAVEPDDRTAALLLILLFNSKSSEVARQTGENICKQEDIPVDTLRDEMIDIARSNSYLMGCLVDQIMGKTEPLWYVLKTTTQYLKGLAKEREARQSN